MNPEERQNTPDHDLLIEIKTELKLFRDESRSINDDTKERLIKIGENKLEKETFNTFLTADTTLKNDHEGRLRFLERYAWLAIGAIGIAEVLIGWYLIVHFNNR
jgi:hypothetical protein